jgi:hypothetical protein
MAHTPENVEKTKYQPTARNFSSIYGIRHAATQVAYCSLGAWVLQVHNSPTKLCTVAAAVNSSLLFNTISRA